MAQNSNFPSTNFYCCCMGWRSRSFLNKREIRRTGTKHTSGYQFPRLPPVVTAKKKRIRMDPGGFSRIRFQRVPVPGHCH